MFAQSVFINRFLRVLEKGVEVGLRETIHDYDSVEERYVSIVVSDTVFKVKSGLVFSRDASSTVWGLLPLPIPFYDLMEILDGGGVEEAYINKDGKETTIWTETNGWISSREMQHLFVPKGLLLKPTLECCQATSLKCLSAMVAFETLGPLKMMEIEHCMDYEVRCHIFKPVSWWVPL